jgi:CheY-like chemotaxis protein/ribosomal protein S27AE
MHYLAPEAPYMNMVCPRCGNAAVPAGHEDARAFFQCETCNRIWMVHLTAGTSGRTQTPRTRVLVVDDSDQLVGLVGMWLEDDGYDVVTATSGSQALDVASIHHPDVVVLDLIIPAPDGFAVCQALRRHARPPEIILMTGLSDPARLRKAEDLGVFALLHKPLSQDAVLDVVARARQRRWSESVTRALSDRHEQRPVIGNLGIQDLGGGAVHTR